MQAFFIGGGRWKEREKGDVAIFDIPMRFLEARPFSLHRIFLGFILLRLDEYKYTHVVDTAIIVLLTQLMRFLPCTAHTADDLL